MVMYALGFQPEYEQLRSELKELKERYEERLVYYAEESEHVKKVLESRYMMTIGRKEFQLFSVQVEIARLRREVSLYQAALSHGGRAVPEEVERILEAEFEQYRQQLEQRRAEVDAAKEHYLAPKLSAKEAKEIQKLYRKLVHQLHPDLNPNLPPGAVEMLHRIQEAYRMSDWPEMVLLGDLVQEMLHDNPQAEHSEDTMEVLRAQVEKLTAKLAQLEEQIKTLHSRPPFIYQEMLEDPEAVSQRREELDGQIEMLKEQAEFLRQHRDELRSK